MFDRLLILSILILACGCSDTGDSKKTNQGLTWLNLDEKFKTIEKQFRGFDKTMVEVGYRYNELYWAGVDKNWKLAKYHIEKIEHTIELGLERRPKRKQSATVIFPVLKELKDGLASEDQIIFKRNFETLRNTCNACHHAEKVPFFNVSIPSLRMSPLRGKPN